MNLSAANLSVLETSTATAADVIAHGGTFSSVWVDFAPITDKGREALRAVAGIAGVASVRYGKGDAEAIANRLELAGARLLWTSIAVRND